MLFIVKILFGLENSAKQERRYFYRSERRQHDTRRAAHRLAARYPIG